MRALRLAATAFFFGTCLLITTSWFFLSEDSVQSYLEEERRQSVSWQEDDNWDEVRRDLVGRDVASSVISTTALTVCSQLDGLRLRDDWSRDDDQRLRRIVGAAFPALDPSRQPLLIGRFARYVCQENVAPSRAAYPSTRARREDSGR